MQNIIDGSDSIKRATALTLITFISYEKRHVPFWYAWKCLTSMGFGQKWYENAQFCLDDIILQFLYRFH